MNVHEKVIFTKKKFELGQIKKRKFLVTKMAQKHVIEF